MSKQTLISLVAPANGKLLALSKVNDPVFSQGLMGQGFAIEPTSGNIVAPADGIVTLVSETKHALGIKTKDGADILIHLGIDTVELNGKPFEVAVKPGDAVQAGDPVIKMNLQMVRDAGKETTIILALTNSNDILQELLTTNFDKDVVAGTVLSTV